MTDDGSRQPLTAGELMRHLSMSLELRPAGAAGGDADPAADAWDCLLHRDDGRTYELAEATFVVYDEDGEYRVEPGPSAVLELLRQLAGTDDAGDDSDARAIRRFLGRDGLALLDRLAS